MAFSPDITFNCSCPGKCCISGDEGVGLTPGEVDSYDRKILAETVAVDHPVYARRIRRVDRRCVFLDPENRCSIYDRRPVVCRLYPLQFNVSHDGSPMLCLDRCPGVYRGKVKYSQVVKDTFRDMPKAYSEFSTSARSFILSRRDMPMPLTRFDGTLVLSRYRDKVNLLQPLRALLVRARDIMADSTGERSLKKMAAAPVVADPLVATLAVMEAALPGMIKDVVNASRPHREGGWEEQPAVADFGPSAEDPEDAQAADPEKRPGRRRKRADRVRDVRSYRYLPPERVGELVRMCEENLLGDLAFVHSRIQNVSERVMDTAAGAPPGRPVAPPPIDGGGMATPRQSKALGILRRDLLGLELPFRFHSTLLEFLVEAIDREGRIKGELFLDVPLETHVRVLVLTASGCLEALLQWHSRATGLRELREAFEKAGVGVGVSSTGSVLGERAGIETGVGDMGAGAGVMDPRTRRPAERVVDPGPLGETGGVTADGPASLAGEHRRTPLPTGGPVDGGGMLAGEPAPPAEADRGVIMIDAEGESPPAAGGGVVSSLSSRLSAMDTELAVVLEEGSDIFAGATVPASPMTVLKNRFSHYEIVIPYLYRRLSRLEIVD